MDHHQEESTTTEATNTSITTTDKGRISPLAPARKSISGGSSWRNMMRKSNTSFGSCRTAATSLLSALDEEREEFDTLYDDDEELDALDCSGMDCSMDFSQLRRCHQEHYPEQPLDSFHASYDLGASLGQGAFGSVHRCTDAISGDSFAVKAVPMDKHNQDEIEILEDLKECPTVVQVQQIFYEADQSFIVMDEMAGGELLERIGQKECYTEREAKIVFRTLLETVQTCHDHGIAHCDLKPENILLQSPDDDTTVKLADFGLAKRFRHADGTTERFVDMHGSAEYAAPEVFHPDCSYDERCDIWSLGTVLYVLLAGYAPFEADTPDEMIREVGKGKFKFHRQYWKDISREAKILIAQMMQVDPDKRIPIQEALASPWFQEEDY